MQYRYVDIDPGDIDPATNRPYSNYSSPSLDTSFHDHEMAGEDDDAEAIARVVAVYTRARNHEGNAGMFSLDDIAVLLKAHGIQGGAHD